MNRAGKLLLLNRVEGGTTFNRIRRGVSALKQVEIGRPRIYTNSKYIKPRGKGGISSPRISSFSPGKKKEKKKDYCVLNQMKAGGLNTTFFPMRF